MWEDPSMGEKAEVLIPRLSLRHRRNVRLTPKSDQDRSGTRLLHQLKPSLRIGPELAGCLARCELPTLRDVAQDTDPASEDDSVRSTPPLKRPSPQADGSPESLHKPDNRAPQPDEARADTSSEEDEHMDATEEQVSETPAPAGDAFKDEPEQG
jgi:hypothetical protein